MRYGEIKRKKYRLTRAMQRTGPGLLVILSFLTAATAGAVLLSLPAASTGDPLAMVDAYFTATSAVCVTGLVVVDTGSGFTAFGKIVILVLIQLGGLGVMTFSVFLFLFIGKTLGLRERWIINETFSANPVDDIGTMLRSIIAFTLLTEAAGAVLLFFVWRGEMSTGAAVFTSIFHSVSAFCNAGLCLFSDSFSGYRGDWLLNITVMSLIVLGGIGFPVIHEFLTFARDRSGHRRTSLSLQTKMVLSTTAFLVLAGAALIFALERGEALAGLTDGEKVLASFFQSVTARTAGFNTIDTGSLEPATLFIIVMLMFVGASPGSTGGGIKTTSLSVFVALVRNKFLGRQSISMFRRTIPEETIERALSILILAALTVVAGLVLLLIFHMDVPEVQPYFLAYLFEAVSAFGTVGLSMGATSTLTAGGKIVIIVMMLLGRVGLLTAAYVITRRIKARRFQYAEEKVMIG